MAGMYFIKHIFRYGFLFLAIYGCASQALPINNGAAKSTSTESDLQSYVWYDGQQRKTVWLNPSLMAEFGTGSAKKSLLKEKFPAASIKKSYRSIQIWQHKTKSFTDTLEASDRSTEQTQSKYSPVFHDAPTRSGSMRSLPGNIIVYLNPDWDKVEIRRWLELGGHEVVKKLDVRANVFVIKTEAGINALQLANELYESGEVVAAFPDWWLESTTR